MNADNVKKLVEILYRDVKTKKGKRYFGHLLRVSEEAVKLYRLWHHQTKPFGPPQDNLVRQVAFLHDIVEDKILTEEDLIGLGIFSEIAICVTALDKHRYKTWEDYISYISTSPILRSVKMADLDHNSKLSRIPPGESFEETQKKHEKYLKAYLKLREIHFCDKS